METRVFEQCIKTDWLIENITLTFKDNCVDDYVVNCNKKYLSVFGTNHSNEIGLCLYFDKLVIQTISIENKRQGCFSRICRIIEIFCEHNNISKIVIQSCLTDEIKNFAIKNGFVKVVSSDDFCPDYSKDLLSPASYIK